MNNKFKTFKILPGQKSRLNFVRLFLEVLETTIGTTICLIVFSTGVNDPLPYLLVLCITLVFVSLFTPDTEIVPIRFVVLETFSVYLTEHLKFMPKISKNTCINYRRPDPPPVERLRPIRHNPRIANEDEDNDNAVPMERVRMVNPIADYFQ